MEQPLILVTNDDGIHSAGLWSLAEGLLPLGEVMIVAPSRQWSGAGRSFGQGTTGAIEEASRAWRGQWVRAYSVDASPAQVVAHALTEIVERPPALVVSGINFGYNLSIDITVSGTVGAALEAAAFGVPAIAASVQVPENQHLTGNDATDYRATAAFARLFGEQILARGSIPNVDVLNINVPDDATLATPWRCTRLSRKRYMDPTAPDRANGGSRVRYRLGLHAQDAEPDSDLFAVLVDRVVSVTPLSLDLSARAYEPSASQNWFPSFVRG